MFVNDFGFQTHISTSLMAHWVKNLPATQETQETQVQSMGWKDPLEKEIATHSSIFTWKTPETKEPEGLQSMGLHSVRQTWTQLSS